MIGWILGVWLAAVGTGVLISDHGGACDSSQLTIALPGGPGRFGIPICNDEIVSVMPSSDLVFENALGRHRIYSTASGNLEWEVHLTAIAWRSRLSRRGLTITINRP